jgi:hypothetical protein
MGREIVSVRDVLAVRTPAQSRGGRTAAEEAGVTKQADPYGERLVKNIPAEVIATFVFLAGVINAAGTGTPSWLLWTVFAVLLVGTPLYLSRAQGVKKPLQLAISTGAFAVWVFSLGDQGPFGTLPWYKPIYGAVLLPLYTFATAVAQPERRTTMST